MSTIDSDVLIVGAGPTGLMLGCQLAIHGINFRIVEKNIEPSVQSRALVIHSRTLEIFDQMKIVDKFFEQGITLNGFNMIFNGKYYGKLDYTLFQKDDLTKFPYLLVIEQYRTEQILENYLKEKYHHIVERSTELINFTQNNDNSVCVTLKRSLDEFVNIQTKYICACDGAHSTVRKKLNVAFPGTTYLEPFFLIDCEINFNDDENKFPRQESTFVFSSNGLIAFFPLINNRWRIIGTMPEELRDGKSIVTFEKIEKDFSKRSNINVELFNNHWISTYNCHHRYALEFRLRKCYFLLGDAAHIHSPFGGQGMNTGLQDAFNLGWKLALVLKKRVINDDQLLDTYNEERQRVAQNLVHTTDRAFRGLTSNNNYIKFIRLHILPIIFQCILFPLINHVRFIRHYFFKKLSQIGIHYRRSSLSLPYDMFNNCQLKCGDRLPSCVIEHFHDMQYFHLLIFESVNENHQEKLFCSHITRYYKDIIKMSLFDPLKVYVYELFGIDTLNGGWYLIRPDMYIACRATTFNIDHFENDIKQLFSISRKMDSK
ncbi:unnamed protein product [Didymodactylos carnosus]|uniref:FAD-binding domain-containing protein n=1 Tax=Didymodactylos carnosus TaxID=1234261 RepID=A0A814KJ55_9BILA|nr:unnamed protein product [Didymodactylos carnosus]CAF1053279.1 unnamed protein product [Didymodactylos carnosus]CAF3815063.1 unnamed protein product [Didymodactylos carnosus]CAF3822595.1 unnamed protein product [Didymodactylos carnosus]